MPSNPFAVRDAKIEWQHQLHEREQAAQDDDPHHRAAIVAQQIDDSYQDYGLQLEMTALHEIAAFRDSLTPPAPARQDGNPFVDPKDQRRQRLAVVIDHARAKNFLALENLVDEDGNPILDEQGKTITFVTTGRRYLTREEHAAIMRGEIPNLPRNASLTRQQYAQLKVNKANKQRRKRSA